MDSRCLMVKVHAWTKGNVQCTMANSFIKRWPIFSLCCFFGVLPVSEQISLLKLRFASYFIHTVQSSQQLAKNAAINTRSISGTIWQHLLRDATLALCRSRFNNQQKLKKQVCSLKLSAGLKIL
jgi:hypothetical protein